MSDDDFDSYKKIPSLHIREHHLEPSFVMKNITLYIKVVCQTYYDETLLHFVRKFYSLILYKYNVYSYVKQRSFKSSQPALLKVWCNSNIFVLYILN